MPPSNSPVLSAPATDAFFSAIVSSSNDAIVSKDLNGTITSWNPSAERIFGYLAEEAIGEPIQLLFPPDRLDEEARIIERIKAGERVEHFETIRKRKDGVLIHVSLTISPIRDANGRIVGASKIARDITDRVNERERLNVAELASARLAALVAGSDDAIIGKDLNGIVTSWNRGAERIFGYLEKEMIGRSIIILLPPDRLNEEQHILARLQRGERVEHFETVRIRKDRRPISVSLTISPIRDGTGKIVGASKIARDITAIQEARRELEQHAALLETRVRERTARLEESLREFEAFAYSLSHDMRAPLRAVQSLAEVIEEDYGEQVPGAVPHLQKIVRSAERLDRLVCDVLQFARIARNEISLSPTNVGDLVREIVMDRPEFRTPKAHVSVATDIVSVQAHEALLSQCLANLLDNAVKYVSHGTVPYVRIFTEPASSGRVRLCVQDNGFGIEAEHQSKLFELFRRLPASEGYEGAGVGLAIVKKAAGRMNGEVGVTSSPGLGSTFWIELDKAHA
jgi:PAS domain S-box-containing protein